jgi:hypothetical protein
MDNIHRTVFYLKYNVSETILCFRLQVEPIQMGTIEGASRRLRTSAITPVRFIKSTQHKLPAGDSRCENVSVNDTYTYVEIYERKIAFIVQQY